MLGLTKTYEKVSQGIIT